MKPLYIQFKEKLKEEQENSIYQNFEIINKTFEDSYNTQKNSSLKFYFFNNEVPDSPNSGISGIAIIFKNSERWGWILAIGNGRIFTKNLSSGSWQNWKEFN